MNHDPNRTNPFSKLDDEELSVLITATQQMVIQGEPLPSQERIAKELQDELSFRIFGLQSSSRAANA